MKIYRLSLFEPEYISVGYRWELTLKAAKETEKKFKEAHGQDYIVEIEAMQFPATRQGILSFLRTVAIEATNG